MRRHESREASPTREQLYVGIDVHKRSWNIHVMSEHISLGRMHLKPPSMEGMLHHLLDRFPHAELHFAYEAGFSGFGLQRSLARQGYECLVVHPADIPTTDKARTTKSDAVDSRKIAEALRASTLRGVWIPSEEEEGDRTLVRYRTTLVQALSETKTRIKQRLLYHGEVIPPEFDTGTWTKRFRHWLGRVRLADASAHAAWLALLADFDAIDLRVKQYSQLISGLAQEPRYVDRMRRLTNIRGIGKTTAMVLLTELGPIERFRSSEALASFVGLVPCERSSAERKITMGMQRRRHRALRSCFVESAWVAIRYDSRLREVYNRHLHSKPAQKAIIVVARKLLNRVYHELKRENDQHASQPSGC